MFEIKNLKFREILSVKYLKIEDAVTCITGASGCGKTTLLKMLNRMNKPDSGEIFYNNKNIDEISSVELRRKVVMMGQASIIYPGDIKENLLIGIKFSEKKEPDDIKLRKCLERVALEKKLEDSCGNLSGGEKQRLCLARVMLMEAETYLLDEPSSALDRKTEEFLVKSFSDFVRKENKQLIMVTHSENAVKASNPTMINMVKGQIVKKGKK